MAFKIRFPQKPKLTPELAASRFCTEIRKNLQSLESQTYNGKTFRNARMRFRSLQESYHRICGERCGSRLAHLADHVDRKVTEILCLNPEDWNNYRRGQQFRRLDERLRKFEIERHRSYRKLEPTTNVIPFLNVIQMDADTTDLGN